MAAAVQVVNRGQAAADLLVLALIQEHYGTELSVRDIFDNSALWDFIVVVRMRVVG